ncbi:MAG: VWA domain-containing protein [Sandaracinaceae bacterium]|nr:VWA domain-containing protein [Sandaracinaceae bacterium]
MKRVIRGFSAMAMAVFGLSLFVPEARAIGLLLPSNGQLEPLAIQSHRVTVSVRERVAESRVEQVFLNTTNQRLEATYIFPLPEGATVSGFAMWVNGRRTEGELLDSNQARSVYEGIVARMRDPGLVEYVGCNLFRARVFPIEPHAQQRIEISFTQALSYESGVVHYTYPLHTSGISARTLRDMTVNVDIVSRTPIRAVYSPSHRISVSRPTDRHSVVGFEASQAILSDDFELYYSVDDRDVGLSLLTHRDAGEDGYFLAMVAPRSQVTEQQIAAKEVIFVFDTSGSMYGEKIERARAALDYMLARLRPNDLFQVVRFSTDVESLFDQGQSAPASPANIARAREFARRFDAAGGTAIEPALMSAVHTRAQNDMPRMVVFLTDGMPTVGNTDPETIVSNVARESGAAQLFVFGVGDDVNTTFLDALAAQNHGVGDYFRDGNEMERRLSAFYDRVAYPLLTELSIAFPNMNAYDIYPRDLGNLYRGGQLLVMGRYRGEGMSHVALNGRIANEHQARTFAFNVNFAARESGNDFLPKVWATRKIGYLLDEIRMHGERAELREEVVALARRFGIVTPYTSYLVVPDQRVEPSPLQRQQGASNSAPPVERRTRPAATERFRAFAPAAAPSPSAGAGSGYAAARGRFADQSVGDAGRQLSAGLRDMRENELATDDVDTASRTVMGRAFSQSGGGWVDSNYRPGMTELHVRYGSRSYFALLRMRPALRSAAALGTRIVIAIDATRAVIIDDTAPEVTDATLSAFLGL